VADGAGGVAARDRRAISKLGFRIEREREREGMGEKRETLRAWGRRSIGE